MANELAKGEQLKKVVDILYDMEMNQYYMEQCQNELNRRIQRLGVTKNIKKPCNGHF